MFLAHMLLQNFIFRNWRPMQLEKLIDFCKVCKCGMLCADFHSVAVYESAVMEFWPLPLEERIKLFLIISKQGNCKMFDSAILLRGRYNIDNTKL